MKLKFVIQQLKSDYKRLAALNEEITGLYQTTKEKDPTLKEAAKVAIVKKVNELKKEVIEIEAEILATEEFFLNKTEKDLTGEETSKVKLPKSVAEKYGTFEAYREVRGQEINSEQHSYTEKTSRVFYYRKNLLEEKEVAESSEERRKDPAVLRYQADAVKAPTTTKTVKTISSLQEKKQKLEGKNKAAEELYNQFQQTIEPTEFTK